MNPLSPFSPRSSDSSMPGPTKPTSKPLTVEVNPIFSVLGQVMAWLGLAIEVKVLENPTDMKPKSLFFSKKHLVKALDNAGIPARTTKIHHEALQTLLLDSNVDLHPKSGEGVHFIIPQSKVRLFQKEIQSPNALLFSGPRGTMVVMDRLSILTGLLDACPHLNTFRNERDDEAFADFLIQRLLPEPRNMMQVAEVLEMLSTATDEEIQKLMSN